MDEECWTLTGSVNAGVPVWICTGQHEPWSRLWPQMRDIPRGHRARAHGIGGQVLDVPAGIPVISFYRYPAPRKDPATLLGAIERMTAPALC